MNAKDKRMGSLYVPDDCTTDPKSYIPFAKAYELSMLALMIEDTSKAKEKR